MGFGSGGAQHKEDSIAYGRVLIVDDEPEVRQAVRLTLTKAGYEVIEAQDGEEGGSTRSRGKIIRW